MSLIEKAGESIKRRESLLERAAQVAREKKSDGVKPSPHLSTPPRKEQEEQIVPVAKRVKTSSRKVEIDLEMLSERGFVTPNSEATAIAEEFRQVKRSLLLNAFGKGGAKIDRGNLVLVTSSRPAEGKTFCAINLAMSIAAERDLTVLLVDADLAKPDILATLGIQGGKGLVDVVLDPSLDLSDCMLRTNIPNLSILPAGRHHNLSTELLASDRMTRIVDEIAGRYKDRMIVFDSSPALASSLGPVLALHVGQCLFVVEAERTTDEDAKEALTLLSRCPNINLLLNKSRFRSRAQFGGYYGYGYAAKKKS